MTQDTPKPVATRPVGRARRARAKPVDPYTDQETPRRVVIYLRVSREEQAEGHSLEAQERECREFLTREHPNWTEVGVFRDTHSGKTDARPSFQKMMRLVNDGGADAILTHRLDRFSRNLHDLLTYFRTLKDQNVILTFAKDRFDFSTEEGQLQFRILAVFADWYLSNLSRETRKGKKARVLSGKHNSRLPFGYRVGKDGIGEPVPEEAEAIHKVYELYAAGNFTDRNVAEYFNKLGLKTRRGRAWSKDSARELMQNETYLGYVKYQGDLYPGLHPPIVEKELFDTVQRVRQQHNRRPRLYAPTQQVYLLSGIARCAACGRTLRAQGGKTYNYYRDMSRMRGFTDCPVSSKAIHQAEAEAQLERLMMAFQLPASWQEDLRAELEASDQREIILKERERLTRKLQRLGELYADGVYDRNRYRRERDAIQNELDLLVLPDPEATLEAGYRLESIGDVWPHNTPEEQQELTRLIFKEVYIDLLAQRIVRVVPDEDFLLLFQHHPYLTRQKDGSYAVSAVIAKADT
ncbi:MAG: recombinase family protein [Anaerolineae bacterium]|nr:recombinase family protein [Anaerolineae bacterium]